MTTLTQEYTREVIAEGERLQAARHYVRAYIEAKGWRIRPHQHLLIAALQRLYNGTLTADFPEREGKPVTTLLVICPPGAGKSDTLIEFAEWYCGMEIAAGRYPEMGFFSYAEDVARVRAQAVADTIEHSLLYREVFPKVKPNKKRGWSTDGWFLQRKEIGVKDPALVQAGLEGQVLSYRIGLAIIDDPHNILQTLSKQKKEDVWFTYNNGIRTRGVGGHMKICCLMTRGADDDLAGRIMTEQAGEYALVRIEALNEETEESYWPIEILPNGKAVGQSAEFLLNEKVHNPRGFYTLWQGKPPSDRGSIFRLIHDHPMPQPEDVIRVYHCWDTATTAKTTSDRTAMVEGCVLRNGKVVVTYVLNFKAETPEVETALWDTAMERHKYWGKPLYVHIEAKASGQPIFQYLQRKSLTPDRLAPGIFIQEHKINIALAGSNVGNPDKVARAEPAGLAMNSGSMCVADTREAWKEPYIFELRAFPDGQYKDQVDATSMLYEATLAYPYDPLPDIDVRFGDWRVEAAYGK